MSDIQRYREGQDPARPEQSNWDKKVEAMNARIAELEAEVERLKKVADQAIEWSGHEMFDPLIHTHDAKDNPELADHFEREQSATDPVGEKIERLLALGWRISDIDITAPTENDAFVYTVEVTTSIAPDIVSEDVGSYTFYDQTLSDALDAALAKVKQ